MEDVLVVMIAVVLFFAALSDWKKREVPNSIVVILMLLAIVQFFNAIDHLKLLNLGLTFTWSAFLFYKNLWGGADVKIISILSLQYVPIQMLELMWVISLIALLQLIMTFILYLIFSSNPKTFRNTYEFPFIIPVFFGYLVHLMLFD